MEFFFSPAVKSNADGRASLREEWDGKNIPFALHFRIVRADVPIGFSSKPGARVTYVGVLANKSLLLHQLLPSPVNSLKSKDLNGTFSRMVHSVQIDLRVAFRFSLSLSLSPLDIFFAELMTSRELYNCTTIRGWIYITYLHTLKKTWTITYE